MQHFQRQGRVAQAGIAGRAPCCSGRSRRRAIPRGEEIRLDKSGEKRKSMQSEISD